MAVKKKKPTKKQKYRGKRKGKTVRRPHTSKNINDQKLCFTKGQLCNIVSAAEKKRGACPTAKRFIKELKAEMLDKNITSAGYWLEGGGKPKAETRRMKIKNKG